MDTNTDDEDDLDLTPSSASWQSAPGMEYRRDDFDPNFNFNLHPEEACV